MRGWVRRAAMLACVALLVLSPVGGKKAKRRKAGFLATPEKREKYADYLLERYDDNSDKALNEDEVDTANDEEALFRIHQKYDDTLPTVRWSSNRRERSGNDPLTSALFRCLTSTAWTQTGAARSRATSSFQRLPTLNLGDKRFSKSGQCPSPGALSLLWPCLILLYPLCRGEEALTKEQLLKDMEEFHEVTDESETEYIGYEFGKRQGSKETPEKQKWIRREYMPEDKMAELVKKYKGTFTKEEIEDHWTTWVLQGKSWKNMEGPVWCLHYRSIHLPVALLLV